MAIGLGGTVDAFDNASATTRSAAVYPEWDYWKQAVLGSVPALDPDVAYRPSSGLPVRRN